MTSKPAAGRTYEIDLRKPEHAARIKTGAGALSFGYFFVGKVDSVNETTYVNISGGLAGATVVNAWATEANADGTPHIGNAVIQTQSVQLDTNQAVCRVGVEVDWSEPVNIGIMMFWA